MPFYKYEFLKTVHSIFLSHFGIFIFIIIAESMAIVTHTQLPTDLFMQRTLQYLLRILSGSTFLPEKSLYFIGCIFGGRKRSHAFSFFDFDFELKV